MKLSIRSVVLWAFVITILLLVLVTIASFSSDLPATAETRLEYLKFILDIYKAIGLGFLITLLVALVPQILPETKYEFEVVKEGREIFSKAKTGIEYMPYNLALLDFKAAIEHIEMIHQLKHLADAYLDENEKAGNWRYDPYEKIVSIREVVTNSADKWDKLSRVGKMNLFMDFMS